MGVSQKSRKALRGVFRSVALAATLLLSPCAWAEAGPDSIVGVWKIVKGGSGMVEFIGSGGQYTGYCYTPVTFDCTHPVGEALFTASYTSEFAGVYANYSLTELWYDDTCQPYGYGDGGTYLNDNTGRMWLFSEFYGDVGQSTLVRVDGARKAAPPQAAEKGVSR